MQTLNRPTQARGFAKPRRQGWQSKLLEAKGAIVSESIRQLKARMMAIHRKNGAVFNPHIVQRLLGLDSPKRWCNCRQGELRSLLASWYDAKLDQSCIEDWLDGYHVHREDVVSQRYYREDCRGGFTIERWTTYFGANTQREAYAILRQMAPSCRFGIIRKGCKAVGNGYRWEVKLWELHAPALFEALHLEGFFERHALKPYPCDGDEGTERAVSLRNAYARAKCKADLVALKGEGANQFSEAEHKWVWNWLLSWHPMEFEAVAAAVRN